MRESISFDMPMPSCTPCSERIRVPPASSSSQVRRPIRQLDRLPQPLAVVPRVGGISVHETVEGLGGRVVRVGGAHRQLLAMPGAGLGDQIVHRDHRLLVLRQRRDVLHQIVPLTRADLRGDGGRHFGGVDVIDSDLDIVRLAPGLGEGIEPGVIRWNEMAPLQNAQAGAGDVRAGRRLLRHCLDP